MAILLCCTMNAQQFLLVENTRNLRNFKYYPGDQIRLKITGEEQLFEGEILDLTDGSIILGQGDAIPISDIEIIFRERFMIQLTRAFVLTAGIAYFSIDTFNRLINHDAPVVLAETAVISASLVGLNFVLLPLRYKRMKTGDWRILLIDFEDLTKHLPKVPKRVP